jgi:beta-lactamase superfamily II metal-dependent hydrolase
MTITNPPHASELELSLFGPGVGESLVVHLGSGNWMIVDSCWNATRDRAIALDYLDSLGVEVATQVKLVVVTHWHDDHIRGMGDIVEAAPSARFACSAALLSKEFFALVAADDHIKLVEHSSGVSEFARVLDILRQRADGGRSIGPDFWAAEGMRLYSGHDDLEIHALSPSSHTITDSKGQFAKLAPSLNEVIRRFPSIRPNDSSVALLVKAAGFNLLLGADLEEGADERRGWKAVIRSEVRPQVMSNAYKVAHHGSPNADLDGIWTDLLTDDSRALITPYARGRKPLPSAADVRRIKSRASHVYCSTWPTTQRPRRRRRNVDRTMNEVALTRRAIKRQPGQIRLRVPIHGNPEDATTELFHGAKQL